MNAHAILCKAGIHLFGHPRRRAHLPAVRRCGSCKRREIFVGGHWMLAQHVRVVHGMEPETPDPSLDPGV